MNIIIEWCLNKRGLNATFVVQIISFHNPTPVFIMTSEELYKLFLDKYAANIDLPHHIEQCLKSASHAAIKKFPNEKEHTQLSALTEFFKLFYETFKFKCREVLIDGAKNETFNINIDGDDDANTITIGREVLYKIVSGHASIPHALSQVLEGDAR